MTILFFVLFGLSTNISDPIFKSIDPISLNESFFLQKNELDIEQDYDMLYRYYSPPKREIEQRLYVKYLSNDRILFRLIIVRENCDTAFDGEAKNDQSVDSEMDEDLDGLMYPVNEYKLTNKDNEFFIRIAQDKTKALIHYVAIDPKPALCEPISAKLMYSE